MTRAQTRREVYTVRTSQGTYEYRGVPGWGPANGRSLRLNGGRWRRGNIHEWRTIANYLEHQARATGLQEG